MDIKECEGCATLGSTNSCSYCNDKLTCPCSICLIKAMCNESCDEFEEYRRKIPVKLIGAK
jgi:hypothetical protein